MHLIFIRHPYPYTLEEYHAIESVLRQLYASATITTVVVFLEVSNSEKRTVLQSLYAQHLISVPAIIDMTHVDLSQVDLCNLDLRGGGSAQHNPDRGTIAGNDS